MVAVSDLQFKTYYDERIYINANVETGILYNRSGRRMLALTNDFLIGLHRAIQNECGDRSAEVLSRCGKKWGLSFGKGLDAEWTQFYESPAREFPFAFFQALLVQEFLHNGWGCLQIDGTQFQAGILELGLQGAIMSEIDSDKTVSPADILTAGIFAGIFSYFIGIDLDCIQTEVPSANSKWSRFILAASDRVKMIRDNSTGKNHSQLMDDLKRIAA